MHIDLTKFLYSPKTIILFLFNRERLGFNSLNYGKDIKGNRFIYSVVYQSCFLTHNKNNVFFKKQTTEIPANFGEPF